MSSVAFASLPTRLVGSELGPVPEGWKVTTLKSATTKIGSGATPRGGSAVYVDEGVAFIRSQNVHDHEFRWEGLARLSDRSAAELVGVQVMPGDVLLNITGDSILRTCVVDPSVLPARVSQHVMIIRAGEGIPVRYLHLYMVHPRTKAMLMGMNAGGTRQAVTKGHLESLAILIPPPELLAAFDRVTAPGFGLVDADRAESRKLAGLRDYLLPRLLSGRVRVRDAERVAAGV
jgi:type I restriction enzyme S subunit